MSQVPPPPPAFQSQQSSPYVVPAKAGNGWGIASLVVGIVGFCVPFVGGLLATVFGIVGIAKGRKRGAGTGLSIAGLILGLISLVVWAVFGSGLLALLGMTQANRSLASQFIKDLHAGNITQAQSATDGTLTKEDLDLLSQELISLGTITDVTTFSTQVVNDTAHLDGIISFSDKKQPYSMDQIKSGGAWKIKGFSTTPVFGGSVGKPGPVPTTTESSTPDEPKTEPSPAGQ